MVLRNHVSAIDELGMATERLRVRLPDEPKPKLLHIIEPHEVESQKKHKKYNVSVSSPLSRKPQIFVILRHDGRTMSFIT